MFGVLSGFLVVLILIGLGFLVGRRSPLGTNAVYALNMFVFWLATPALLINFLATADLSEVFGTNLSVVVLSSLLAGALGYLGFRRLARRDIPDSLVGLLACTYCNGSNLGIPLVTHVLGDPTASLPVIIFQTAFYGPTVILLLDLSTQKTSSNRGSWRIIREVLLSVLRNPLILAATLGIMLAALRTTTGWTLPILLAEPIATLASAAVPVALIAFGMSMAQVKVLGTESPQRSVWFAALIKTIVHPLIAIALAIMLFNASGHFLLACAVVAALPTGQNVFAYAQRFGRNTILARDTGVISTLLSIPSIALIVLFLS